METTITLKDLLKRWKEEAHIEKDVTLVSKKGRCLIICTQSSRLVYRKRRRIMRQIFSDD